MHLPELSVGTQPTCAAHEGCRDPTQAASWVWRGLDELSLITSPFCSKGHPECVNAPCPPSLSLRPLFWQRKLLRLRVSRAETHCLTEGALSSLASLILLYFTEN